ncbi:hypothetical protein PAP_06525 [Palaeococcus pacificus DY20341]|uniref:KaiC domain-containing protein n=1 Tax=Palaeococcus pacificus DY20341 TaxID=1343739 RepID=A0A075LUN8_9EURY|nr:ATPase domain-containing protein [Palaeococcus pacificus]AIF69702.1 hypothetical protein PAP_06525 [Palaeococcus pacificus DY20341]
MKSMRAKFGIEPLDDVLLNGGIPKGNIVLIVGQETAGKTILSWQFVYNGVKKFREKSLFVSLEGRKKEIIEYLSSFYNRRISESKSLQIIGTDKINEFLLKNDMLSSPIEGLIILLNEVFSKFKPDRLVIDDIYFLFPLIEKTSIQKEMFRLYLFLKSKEITTIITTMRYWDRSRLTMFCEDNCCDGTIELEMAERSIGLRRYILVHKMRGTAHLRKKMPYEIADGGIMIYYDKEMY